MLLLILWFCRFYFYITSMVYVYLHTCGVVRMPVNAWEDRKEQWVSPLTLCLISLPQGFSVMLELAVCPLPVSCRDLPVSAPPPKSSAGMQPHLAFYTGVGILTHVLTLMQQTFLLTDPFPQPQFLFLVIPRLSL